MFNGSMFWQYYTNVTKGRNSAYQTVFGRALYEAGVASYTSESYVKNNLTAICKSMKVYMLTAKVPQGVVNSILLQFKKWVNEYYR